MTVGEYRRLANSEKYAGLGGVAGETPARGVEGGVHAAPTKPALCALGGPQHPRFTVPRFLGAKSRPSPDPGPRRPPHAALSAGCGAGPSGPARVPCPRRACPLPQDVSALTAPPQRGAPRHVSPAAWFAVAHSGMRTHSRELTGASWALMARGHAPWHTAPLFTPPFLRSSQPPSVAEIVCASLAVSLLSDKRPGRAGVVCPLMRCPWPPRCLSVSAGR